MYLHLYNKKLETININLRVRTKFIRLYTSSLEKDIDKEKVVKLHVKTSCKSSLYILLFLVHLCLRNVS